MKPSAHTLPAHSYDYGHDWDAEPESWTETHQDHWCGMAITVTAELKEQRTVQGKIKEVGTVKSIEIVIDNDELYNAFNGHYDEILNEYVERVTGWDVPENVEIC